MKIERKSFDMAEFKMTEEGSGGFSAYVSTFGNVDDVNEVVVRGAFKDTIRQFVEDGWVPPSNHNWEVSGIATITAAREDEKGLYVEAEFHSTDDAQRERVKMRERLQRGKNVKFSIGYSVLEDEVVKGVRYLKKLELYEACPVNVPANRQAQALSAKSLLPGVDTKGLLGSDIERSVALYVLDSLYWRLWNAVYNQLESDPANASALAPIFDEFRDLIIQAASALMGSADGQKAAATAFSEMRDRAQVKAVGDDPAHVVEIKTMTTDTGKAVSTTSDEATNEEEFSLIAESKELKNVADTEFKAGRTLSQQNYDRISKHADRLEETATALTESAADMRGLLKEAVPDDDEPAIIKARQSVRDELLKTELEITLQTTTTEG